MKVAVCDDNKVMLEFISGKAEEALISLNIDHEISNFERGMDFLSRQEKTPFDVVFLDIRLPDIDGFEAAHRSKIMSEKTQIIFVTTESSLVYESFDYQPFNFIPKGKPDYLADKIHSVLCKLID